MTTARNADFNVDQNSSIVLITPMTPAACLWLIENCGIQSWQWTAAGSVAVDWRYAEPIMEAMQDEGFAVN